jgi:hypothetical protein
MYRGHGALCELLKSSWVKFQTARNRRLTLHWGKSRTFGAGLLEEVGDYTPKQPYLSSCFEFTSYCNKLGCKPPQCDCSVTFKTNHPNSGPTTINARVTPHGPVESL